MELKNHRIKAIIVFVTGTGLISLVFFNLGKNERNIGNFFTLYGTLLSLYGLWLAYLQIRSINETSVLTKQAVETSLIRINQILSISELSRANKIIQEIQLSLLSSKQELALMRMKDLKNILIQVKYNGDLIEYTDNGIYNQQITDLGSDINNIHDYILNPKKTVNISKVNKNLEGLATVIIEFENKLKFQNT